jgi:hypothetical protein
MPVISASLFQRRHHFQDSLRERFGLIGMRPGESFDARHLLVHARIVFHGAGAERIEAEIDGVVLRGEAREVADGFHFADFGEIGDFGARVFGAERARDRRRGRPAEAAGNRACRASCAQTTALRSGLRAGGLS